VRNPKALPPLTEEQVLCWADLHLQRTGAWATEASGLNAAAPGETWRRVAEALRVGGRGLPRQQSGPGAAAAGEYLPAGRRSNRPTSPLNRRAIDGLACPEARTETCPELRPHARGPLALGIIDIDHFREINRRYQLPGDALLTLLDRALTSGLRAGDSLRPGDSLRRLDGDKFLVACPNTNHEGAGHLSERVRRMAQCSGIGHKDQVIRFAVSIGFAVADGAGVSYDRMLRVARAALAEAQAAGGNRWVVRTVTPAHLAQDPPGGLAGPRSP
jgi:diguanylate cyclase (GGDEF)-like protein